MIMTSFPISRFLAEWALRSSILILSGSLLLWALRVKDASIRLAAWTAMLCGSLAIPVLTGLAPRMPVPVMHSAPQSVEAPAPSYAMSVQSVPERPWHEPNVSKPLDWGQTAVTVYVLVALALLLRLCVGLTIGLRLLRSSLATGQAAHGIEIRESDRVASPVALGIARPVIMLPVDWRQWDKAKLEAVLAHESSHIRRHDPVVQLLSAIHRALLWHSPLSWVLHRRTVRMAEEVSDDAAVAAICDRASYAEVLLEFMRRGVRGASWQGVPMARHGAPAERIHRILDGTALSRGVTLWSIAAILVLGAPLAYLTAAVQATAPQQSAAVSPGARPLTFDAASVKPASVPDGVRLMEDGRVGVRKGSGIQIPPNTGGPGTDDPGRIHYPLITLKQLLRRAWDSYYEIDGPGWLDSQAVTVDATMPPETTKAQFQEMLRKLLSDRFGLQYHVGKKEITGYTLVIAGNGPKLKESADQSEAEWTRAQQIRGGKDGFPAYAPVKGKMLITMQSGDRSRILGQQVTLQALVKALSSELKTTITDATGLTAKYDFTLTYASLEPLPPPAHMPEVLEPLPDIFSALQSDLGLKLEAKKVSVEVFVVNHMERTPTGN